jgi:polyisoprenoid-binding protein YceI
MKRIGLVLSLFVLAASSHASAAQHWKVDPAKSKLGFTVSWGGQPFTGVFRSWTADIDFDPADLTHSKANVNVNIGSESSGDSETDESVKGTEGFAASQFPAAQFRLNSFTHKSGDAYVGQGMLSLKGISRPVTLPFTLTLSGNTAHAVGKAQVMRTDFHVGTGEWEKPDPVAHEVTVNVDLTATKG